MRTTVLLVFVSAPAFGGALPPCPKAPHCVSSVDRDAGHAVEAFAFTGDPAAAWVRLKRAVSSLPRTTVAEEREGYLHAVCVSKLLRFKDDLEFRLDPAAGRIEVRSSSRIGYADMGVNRRRVERVRREFERLAP